tara:strand:- start:23316 stop:23825 length:510 start_codon:yes stop_codon:yes gene_type:complete
VIIEKPSLSVLFYEEIGDIRGMVSLFLILLIFSLAYFIPRLGSVSRTLYSKRNGITFSENRKTALSSLKDTSVGLIIYLIIVFASTIVDLLDDDLVFAAIFFPMFLFVFPIVGSGFRWLIFYRKSKSFSEIYDDGHIIDMYIGIFMLGIGYLLLDNYGLIPLDWSLTGT